MNPPGAAIIHNQSGHLFCTGGVMLCVSHGSRFLRQGRTTTESGRNTLLRTRTGDPFLAAARQSDKQLWLKDDDPVTSPHFFINLGRPVQGFSSSKRHTCAPRFQSQHNPLCTPFSVRKNCDQSIILYRTPGDQHDMSTPAGNGQLDDMVVAGAQPDKLVGMRPGWAALAIICEGLKADNPQCQKNDHQRRKNTRNDWQNGALPPGLHNAKNTTQARLFATSVHGRIFGSHQDLRPKRSIQDLDTKQVVIAGGDCRWRL